MTARSVSKICSVDGCDRVHYGKTLCEMHWRRWRKHANPFGLGSTPDQKFWVRVAITADDSRCWIWQAGRTKDGYGNVAVNGHYHVRAHRAAWFYTYGRYPADILRHTCDTPLCVNPKHLLEGSHADNVRDKVRRNRQMKGEHVPNAVLRSRDIPVIRQLLADKSMSQTDIAKQFGVSRRNIGMIKNGHTWRHVD